MQPVHGVKVDRPAPIGSLTGIRFWLSLYVVLYHFTLQFYGSAPLVVQSFFSAGFSAVSMFFALSGYVLAYNHFDGQKIDLRKFWIARVARIVPAFAVAEAICAGYLCFSLYTHHLPMGRALFKELTISCLFLESWVRPFLTTASVNGPQWSLSCEIFFYLLFPLFAIPISRLNKRALRLVCVAFIVLSVAGPLIYLLLTPDGLSASALTERAQDFYTTSPAINALRAGLWHKTYGLLIFLPIFHLPVFLFGAALGRYRRAYLNGARSRTKLRQGGFAISASALILVLIFSANIPHLLMHECVVGVLFGFCMLFSESSPSSVIRFLEWKPMLLLGEASYAIYLLQYPVMMSWSVLERHVFHLAASTVSSTLCFIAALILISAGIFEWIERPARLHIRRVAYGGKPAV